jgi:hypothetical protein
MNRHERRRAAAIQRDRLSDEWDRAARGFCETTVVRREYIHHLMADPAPLAEKLLQVAMRWHRDAWVTGKPPLCACCDRTVAAWCPAVVVHLPYAQREDAEVVITSGVCENCAELDDAEIVARAAKAMGGGPIEEGTA